MVIKASSAKEIDALVADLASDAVVKREAAVARLTVIGARAVERLIALATNSGAPLAARLGAFRSLEGIEDDRALDFALAAFKDPDSTVAIAALNVARPFLRTPRGVKALDHVTAVALDRQHPARVRLAAIQALCDLPPATVEPVITALKADSDPEIAHAFDPGSGLVDAVQRLQAAADGKLPAESAALRRAIARSSADVPASALQQVIDRVRVQEGSEPEPSRTGWMAARAAAHLALAQRGSRLALYDLRETVESAVGPVPGEFLAALTAIGDASCLEPIAAAHARAATGRPPNDWWQRHLTDAFRGIVNREQITRRHAVIKRIEKRWKATFDALWVGKVGRAGLGR